jgi:hypothetical protein
MPLFQPFEAQEGQMGNESAVMERWMKKVEKSGQN